MNFLGKKWILSFLTVAILPFSCLLADTLYQKNDCKTKVEELNKEIKYLEDLKQGLEGRATRYENQAQRLQFDKDQLLEAKRFWNMAEQNRKAAAEIELKIQEKNNELKQVIEKNHCKEGEDSASLLKSEVNFDDRISNELKEKKNSASEEAVIKNGEVVADVNNNEKVVCQESEKRQLNDEKEVKANLFIATKEEDDEAFFQESEEDSLVIDNSKEKEEHIASITEEKEGEKSALISEDIFQEEKKTLTEADSITKNETANVDKKEESYAEVVNGEEKKLIAEVNNLVKEEEGSATEENSKEELAASKTEKMEEKRLIVETETDSLEKGPIEETQETIE